MKKLPSLRKFVTILVSLSILLSAAITAIAQEDTVAWGKNVANTPSQAQGPTDPAELEAFLDDFFARKMEEFHIAGAAISVVKDGQLLFAKGYGYADLENKIPVDPEQTIFRVGSVGKTFTWTAVMQLVEQGKLDLEADINTYLDFSIPDTYPQPITLKHLMTHTSGFDDRWIESLVSDDSELMSAREWLTSNMPGPVRPPGEAAGYSNYNAMLAGYIVARVSGQDYTQYMQEYIFTPLGMTLSSAQSPIPEGLRANLSKGYVYENGVFQAFPNYTAQPALMPSGGHQMSVTDMARFMVAHLQGGFYGDASTEMRILEESTARQMQNTLYTPDPRLLGMAYGFADMSDNGQWTLGHEGTSPPMKSQLLLLPDQHLGIFVVYNGDAGDLTTQHYGFQRAFFDHYYPAPAAEPIQPPADFAERAGRFVGLYKLASSNTTTPEKIMGLFGYFNIEISDPGDGTLLVPIEGIEMRFVEVEPLYFRRVDAPFAIVFRENEQGRITHMFTDLMPQYALVKLNWYESPGFHMVVLLVCILVFLSMLPVAVIRALGNRRPGGDRNPDSRGARVAYQIILGICLLNLLFLVGVAIKFPPTQPSELHGVVLTTTIAMGLGVLAAILTVGALVYAVLAWKNTYWSVAFRAYYTLVTIAAVAFVWFLHYWNWLGWRY
ncbi:MAG TPA: serine hydrolase domain-containing protein [Anaerolineales bacterium]|nr:serine hydrolase domain-containing protein [Anaerolineales bacterium]